MRLCFIGDSYVNGTGDAECLGWSGRLCARARHAGFDLTHYNLGVRRETSADIARRWRQEAALRLPAECDGRLVFSFGVNDCIIENGVPRIAPEVTLEHARDILAAAVAWQPTLFIGPPPIAEPDTNARIAALGTALRELCGALTIPCFDSFAPLAASNTWRRELAAGDGAHPGGGGYALWADLIEVWPHWRAWLTAPDKPA